MCLIINNVQKNFRFQIQSYTINKAQLIQVFVILLNLLENVN